MLIGSKDRVGGRHAWCGVANENTVGQTSSDAKEKFIDIRLVDVMRTDTDFVRQRSRYDRQCTSETAEEWFFAFLPHAAIDARATNETRMSIFESIAEIVLIDRHLKSISVDLVRQARQSTSKFLTSATNAIYARLLSSIGH